MYRNVLIARIQSRASELSFNQLMIIKQIWFVLIRKGPKRDSNEELS